ncbi:hypothetical protein NG895_15090 [Aeoliella sp. ICT_H6.2]|uniref:Uncharacterized protein n=1 Tax=Aeoliella straminimaris TaxID=2954799 RepID=A0A9X2JGP7_9BACT|nr:hypothetical protein [Aeoliella straminimaris]MCO6045235.1 hypothetical protein [Aeoliella straminimaris]
MFRIRVRGVASQALAGTLLAIGIVGYSPCLAAVDDAEQVLQKLANSRVQLTSGIYRIEGERHIQRGERDERYPVTMRCAFDHAKKSSHFQRSERIPWLEDGVQVDGGLEVGLQLIRRPDSIYLYRSGVGPEALTIRSPDFAIESPVMPIDIRTLGLTTFVEGEQARRLELALESFSPEGVVKCEKNDGVWEIQWRISSKGPTIMTTLQVDETKQFSPIKLSYHLEHTQADGAQEQWGQTSEVTWKEVSGVWVPESARIEHRNARTTTTYDLKVAWEKVNEAIDPAQFEMKSMELPGPTLVSDHRTGGPVLVGTFDELP